MADDLTALRDALRDQCEALARHLHGEPNRKLSGRRELRWGKKGSLRMKLSGPHRGHWHNTEAGTHGDGLAMIQARHPGGFKETLQWAYHWTGLAPGKPAPALTIQPQPIDPAKVAAVEAEEAGRIDRARLLWDAGVPITGTIAEKYLTGTRRFPRPAAGWPAAARFHARDRALMLALTAPDGRISAVQLVYLTLDAHKNKSRLGEGKATYGVMHDACVRLPGKAPALIAEGPETGLACWVSTGHATLISCGPVSRLTEIPTPAVIVQDDDPRHSQVAKSLTKAMANWQANGRMATLATPWPVRRFDKSDMADVIFADGPAAVRARIDRAMDASLVTTRRVPVHVGRELLPSALLPLFVKASASSDPVAYAVRGNTGLGKSHEIRRQVAIFVRMLRAKDDNRSVVIAVPRHDLADEYATALQHIAPDLAIKVWRGRKQPDPEQPGKAMCGDLPAVKEARNALLEVDQFACGPCELRDGCAHLRQRNSSADVWIVPHSLLTSATPKAFGTLAVLVIDENPIGEFLIGADARHPLHLPLDAFTRCPSIEGDRISTDRLHDLYRQAGDVLRRDPTPGPIMHASFAAKSATEEEEGIPDFTLQQAIEARGLTWRTMRKPVISDTMTRAARLEAIREAAAVNGDLKRRGTWWDALVDLLSDDGPQASGKASLEMSRDDDPRPVIRLKGRSTLRTGWQVPTLICDATMELDLLRHVWPRIEMSAEIETTAPHQFIHQVTDRAYSLAMLDPDGTKDAKERQRRQNRLRDLHAVIAREARQAAPGVTLVVAQLRIRMLLEAMGNLPETVQWGHHNAVTGLDGWKDARLIIVIGRTLPSPAAMEDAAEALTGAAIQRLEAGTWFPRMDTTRETTQGLRIPTEADQHPNPTTEMFRRTACEHQLVQIIGRGRGGNRTAADPLFVLLLTDVPLDLPIDQAIAAADLAPSPADLMLAAGGVAYEEPAAASRAYRNLWPTRHGAGRAIIGADPVLTRSERFPYKSFSYGNRSHLVSYSFRTKGPGQRPSIAWVLASIVDPRTAIEVTQGELAHFETVPQEPEPPPPPESQPAGLELRPTHEQVMVLHWAKIAGARHMPLDRPHLE